MAANTPNGLSIYCGPPLLGRNIADFCIPVGAKTLDSLAKGITPRYSVVLPRISIVRINR